VGMHPRLTNPKITPKIGGLGNIECILKMVTHFGLENPNALPDLRMYFELANLKLSLEF